MNPRHRPPDPELVRPLEWERTTDPERGDLVRIRSRRTGAWVTQQGWCRHVLEGIEAGEGFEAIVDRFHAGVDGGTSRRKIRDAAGDVLFSLYREGYVDLPYALPPEPLHDRYDALEELGRGAVGVVWRCRDRAGGDQVGVKRGWGFFLAEAAADEAIRREAGVLADLDHPRVPTLRTTFEDGGRTHLVRDLVEGDPLVGRPVDVPTLSQVGQEVADILHHLHDRGYLLLDLTPGNFLRTPDGVVLIDPGLCRPLEKGEVVLEGPLGSPGFQAPEVRRGERALPSSDVDGLGRLLFTLATGRRPGRRWGPDEMVPHLDDPRLGSLVEDLCHPHAPGRPDLVEAAGRLAELTEP